MDINMVNEHYEYQDPICSEFIDESGDYAYNFTIKYTKNLKSKNVSCKIDKNKGYSNSNIYLCDYGNIKNEEFEWKLFGSNWQTCAYFWNKIKNQ